MLIKTLEISQLIYSTSNLSVPAEIEDGVKPTASNFFGETRKTK